MAGNPPAKSWSRWLWWPLLALLAVFLAYQMWVFCHVCYWSRFNPSESAFMTRRREAMQATRPAAKLRHRWQSYDRISVHLKRALIASEDMRFLDHAGFDWEGIEKALEENQKKGRIVAGGSTISQQLAKNLFLSGARTPWRKGEEALITVMLEQIMSKRRIFEIYLNVIEWGEGVFGAEAAARHYYGCSAGSLSPDQAARLAAMVPRPRYYDRNRDAPRLERKTRAILGRMSKVDDLP